MVGHTYSIMGFNADVQYFGCFFVAVSYKEEAQEKQIYEVTLIYQDKIFIVKALYDSGNTLMTRKNESVHVLAPSIWKELIGEDPWKEDGFAVPVPDSWRDICDAGNIFG